MRLRIKGINMSVFMDKESKSAFIIQDHDTKKEYLRVEWDRIITEEEVKMLEDDPYCLFKKGE